MIIILRRLRRKLLTVLAACLILLGLCWGLPEAYRFLATEKQDYRNLDDPVRVEKEEVPEDIALWLNTFGN